jgi:hypothetical protein
MEHGGEGPAVLLALEQSVLGAAMRQSIYLYPAVEIVHIFGFILLVGSIIAFDLRLLGLVRELPADRLARLLVRLSMLGFAAVVPSGLLLFATEATAVWANPIFPVKLGFIAAGLLNVALFHAVIGRNIAGWGIALPPAPARVVGAVSLAAWGGAIVCGRLLAYF